MIISYRPGFSVTTVHLYKITCSLINFNNKAINQLLDLSHKNMNDERQQVQGGGSKGRSKVNPAMAQCLKNAIINSYSSIRPFS